MIIDEYKLQRNPRVAVNLCVDEKVTLEKFFPFLTFDEAVDTCWYHDTKLDSILCKNGRRLGKEYDRHQVLIEEHCIEKIINYLYENFDLFFYMYDDTLEALLDFSIPHMIEFYNYFVCYGDWVYRESIEIECDTKNGVTSHEIEASFYDYKSNKSIEFDDFKENLAKGVTDMMQSKIDSYVERLKKVGAEKIYYALYNEKIDIEEHEDWIYEFERMKISV